METGSNTSSETVKPRTSARTNKGVPPVRYPNNQAVLPTPVMSKTFAANGLEMSRVTVSVPEGGAEGTPQGNTTKTEGKKSTDTQSLGGSVASSTMSQKMLNLQKIKLQIERAEEKLKINSLRQEELDMEMSILAEKMGMAEGSQYLGSDEENLDDAADNLDEREHEKYSHQEDEEKIEQTNPGMAMGAARVQVPVENKFVPTPRSRNPRKKEPVVQQERVKAQTRFQVPRRPPRKLDARATPFIPQASSTPHAQQQSNNTQPASYLTNPQPSTSVDALAVALVQAFQQQNANTERFVARQSQESRLPVFTGNPLDWPLFIHHYRQSTMDCGYTRSQNMARLEKAIQGHARKAVQALMIIPSNADMVISTLEQRYGRAEYVIQSLVDLAKKTPSPKEGRLSSILDYANSLNNLVQTIKALNTPAHLQNPQLMKELVEKLPDGMRLQWGEHVIGKPTGVTLEDLTVWINRKAAAASIVTTPDFQTKSRGRDNVMVAVEEGSSKKCPICGGGNHYAPGCKELKLKTVNERWQLTKQKQLCIGCLAPGHGIKVCRRKKICNTNGCQRNHHPLLHSDVKETDRAHKEKENGKDPPRCIVKEEINGISSQTSRSVLLRTIAVHLYGPNGEMSKEHAIFDECSTVTIMDESLADQLGLTGQTDPLRLWWTNKKKMQEDFTSRRVSVGIGAVGEKAKFTLNNVRTLKDLSLPSQPFQYEKLCRKWKHLNAVKLPDMDSSRPRLLIGQPHAHLTVAREVIEDDEESPMLTRTRLGWVVHGPLGGKATEDFTLSSFHVADSDLLHDLVRENFKLESIGIKQITPRSKQDQVAEHKMEAVTRRVGDRWETGLLWKQNDEDVKLPNSYEVAYHRLLGVEARFRRDPNLKEEYIKKINHYLSCGYARRLSKEETKVKSNKEWIQPHFPVFHPMKPGKVRIVFDGSSKSNGVSLNDHLLTGPDLLISLPGVLMAFRLWKVAYIGDITEMFHQVKIREEDCPAQRFLFREDPKKPPDMYQLEVMMFGGNSSPYQAQFVKNLNASEFEREYPAAVRAIHKRHYMDDYLDCSQNEEQALKLITDVTEVHRRGGFVIGKWVTNSPSLQQILNQEKTESTPKDISEWSEVKTERVLGLHWNQVEDIFTFRVNLQRAGKGIADGTKQPTKREVLRMVMLIFDPLGFILHYTMKARIFLQHVWKSKIGWDDEVPTDLWKKWQKWLADLPKIANVKIPRCYSFKLPDSKDVQLHILADASEAAMIAVAYLRVATEDEVQLAFITAKGRVAPLKLVSIPRLELQAALIAARMGPFITEELGIKLTSVKYWTDSQTVLKWMRSDSRKFQQFVGHRIGAIHELTNVADWLWVPTKLNVADDATREGKTDLSPDSRWWSGPGFLLSDPEDWKFEVPADVDGTEMELRKEFLLTTVETPNFPVPVFERISKYTVLVRATARVLKFVEILKKRKQGEKIDDQLPLSQAENLLFQKAQWDSYPEEMDLLTRGNPISKSSKLCKLNPVVDGFGVLRMDSRLINAEVESLRKPIILESKHYLTKLIIQHYHVLACHQGQEMVKNEVRQRFWIPNLKTAVRRCWHECLICKIRRAKPTPPMMGILPQVRVEPQSRSFTVVGMDYFGPIEITVGRRHEKRYGVLFTCMTTRAVHLEIAASLTTDSCIMAIRRMIGRRGHPKEIYSDNGTNLRGADKELQQALDEIDQEAMAETLSVKGIKWNFIPPSAPHMGGSWERLVRSVKTAMSVIMKSRYPKEEVLQTVMAEAEAIVNSRPLVDVPVDPVAPEALTPMHFLIGNSSILQPPGEFDDRDLTMGKRWRTSQRLADMFWQRWRKEYLPTLQRRGKWHGKVPNLKEGDIVIVLTKV